MTGLRRVARSVARLDPAVMRQRGTERREFERASTAALPYAGLWTTSLTLAGLDFDGSLPRSINLLIGEIREDRMFAGIHTALTAAGRISARLALPLRVVMLDSTSLRDGARRAAGYIERELGLPDVTVVAREQLGTCRFGPDDLWLATHSKTAHAIQVACSAGLVDAARVIYLVQDYEPGFTAWSTTSVIASATYHAGFLPVVNSLPLKKYLVATEGIRVDDDLVFAPAFDEDRLRRTAANRSSSAKTVLFYARPSKPRNLYSLGIAALKVAVAELGEDAAHVRFVSAGEKHPAVSLGSGSTLESLGRLDWDAYFEFLSGTSVVLGLQASPHPSHPPLDAAISGALAVTNDFASTRAGLHPRLRAVPADVPSLAAAVVDAIRNPPTDTAYRPVAEGKLGRPLDDVVETLAARFAGR